MTKHSLFMSVAAVKLRNRRASDYPQEEQRDRQNMQIFFLKNHSFLVARSMF